MCSASGSLSILCSNTSGQCDCKRNVEGRDCLQCTGETFNLQPSNPHGCQPCFCSGQSTVCTSAPGYAAVVVSTRFNETADHGWTTTDNETDLSLRSSAGVVLEPNTATYLQAPPEFVGNKLSSYSQYVTVAVNSSVETTLLPADVVLSTMVMSVGANFSLPVFRDGLTVFQLQLHEVAGWTDMASNLPIDAYNLQLILSSLTELYVTASYDDAVAINTITLDSTEPASTVDDEVSWVEQCSCPSNYDGFSCELCADGYTRSSSGSCEPCQCNGFADSCDPETGTCTNCSGFTTGDSCEFCQVGTYGDPLQGTPCLPCPCPLTTEPGQFSTNCSFNETLNQVMCFGCPTGHSGLRCESCINGYFGDPTGVLAGTPTMCSDCQCSGNINLDDPEACDNTSGICLQCLYNTSGNQCEVCADGYYGDAINAKNCSGKTQECEIVDVCVSQCHVFCLLQSVTVILEVQMARIVILLLDNVIACKI